jgi:hypothetical protein
MRVRTALEQEIWSECSRLLANCVIFYNASVRSEFLARNDRQNDASLAGRIKRISPVSWRHVNFYGEYTFRDIDSVIDLIAMLAALEVVA